MWFRGCLTTLIDWSWSKRRTINVVFGTRTCKQMQSDRADRDESATPRESKGSQLSGSRRSPNVASTNYGKFQDRLLGPPSDGLDGAPLCMGPETQRMIEDHPANMRSEVLRQPSRATRTQFASPETTMRTKQRWNLNGSMFFAEKVKWKTPMNYCF